MADEPYKVGGLCDQCGHEYAPHIIVADPPDDPLLDMAHTGKVVCQVVGCRCFSTWETELHRDMGGEYNV